MSKSKSKPKIPKAPKPLGEVKDEMQSLPLEEGESDGMASRAAALKLLEDVLQRKQALDHALEHQSAFRDLPVRDRAFVRMMVSTIMRRLGQIDDLIEKAIEKKDTPRNLTLQNILRIGAAQILFMDVADHAAVDTSVRLAENNRMDKQKAFVNGLLRTLTRVGAEWRGRQDEGRLNTPEWLLKTWIADYDLRVAAEIAQANLSEAPLDITVKNKDDKVSWAATFKATELTTGSLRIPGGGNVTELPGFAEGAWWVQDASAAIPARLMGDITGQSVIDLCAAPGGKTMQLAAMGANVIALDRSTARIRRLQENIDRMQLGERVQVVTADASTWRSKDPVPYILLDAPCSATGTIRRHPDVLRLKEQKDVTALCHAQEQILENAFAMLMVGGILVYCTCSLQKAEGEDQINALLARHANAARLPIMKAELGGWDEALTEDGDLRILPFHQAALGGMDGFFIARVTKVA